MKPMKQKGSLAGVLEPARGVYGEAEPEGETVAGIPKRDRGDAGDPKASAFRCVVVDQIGEEALALGSKVFQHPEQIIPAWTGCCLPLSPSQRTHALHPSKLTSAASRWKETGRCSPAWAGTPCPGAR